MGLDITIKEQIVAVQGPNFLLFSQAKYLHEGGVKVEQMYN